MRTSIDLTVRCWRPFAAIGLAIVMAGCQSVGRHELTWQSLHAIDVLQTVNAAGDPCYRESSWLTKQLIGAQPGEPEVVVWGIATAMAHLWIADLLERRHAPRWVRAGWNIATIGETGYAVMNNQHIGVRPWGANETPSACRR